MKEEIICGIYKITSPTGRVYVGQSLNIVKNRLNVYKNLKCKTQTFLYRSLRKYGWDQHTFEIIEECSEEELNCRERYWQDFYDVINGGLNCILTECGDDLKRYSEETKQQISQTRLDRGLGKGDKNPKARKVINYQNKEIIECAKYLVPILNINYQTLMSMLSGANLNSTSWCFLDDYIDNTYKENLKASHIIVGEKVICTKSLKIWKSMTECANELGLRPQNLMRYLSPNNGRKNPTSIIYLKDFK